MIETEDLTPEQAAAELERIAAEMAKSDIAYYQNDAPYLTDAEYDALKRRNRQIEARFPELIRADSPSKESAPRSKTDSAKFNTVFPCFRWATSSALRKSTNLPSASNAFSMFPKTSNSWPSRKSTDFLSPPAMSAVDSFRAPPAATAPPAKTLPPI